MSKSSQQRQSMYALGVQDYKRTNGRYFRYYKRHPLYSYYRRGWYAEIDKKHKRKFKLNTLFSKLFRRGK